MNDSNNLRKATVIERFSAWVGTSWNRSLSLVVGCGCNWMVPSSPLDKSMISVSDGSIAVLGFRCGWHLSPSGTACSDLSRGFDHHSSTSILLTVWFVNHNPKNIRGIVDKNQEHGWSWDYVFFRISLSLLMFVASIGCPWLIGKKIAAHDTQMQEKALKVISCPQCIMHLWHMTIFRSNNRSHHQTIHWLRAFVVLTRCQLPWPLLQLQEEHEEHLQVDLL